VTILVTAPVTRSGKLAPSPGFRAKIAACTSPLAATESMARRVLMLLSECSGNVDRHFDPGSEASPSPS
jgi:hypothetical protein